MIGLQSPMALKLEAMSCVMDVAGLFLRKLSFLPFITRVFPAPTVMMRQPKGKNIALQNGKSKWSLPNLAKCPRTRAYDPQQAEDASFWFADSLSPPPRAL